jgi:hypothetical protein
MKRLTQFAVLVSVLLLSRGFAQTERFLGTWETRRSSTTGRINLTVNIVQADGEVRGNITFVNPDRTTMQWPITNSEIKGTALDFETLDHDTAMHWSLVLTNRRTGVLRGGGHELLVEEKVRKKDS